MSFKAEVQLDKKINVEFKNGLLSINGPRGSCIKDFSKVRIKLEVNGDKINLESYRKRREDLSLLNTVKKHIMNMSKGVLSGWAYKLKIAYSHFPITINVKGDQVLIENFYGERVPRIAKIESPQVKVSISGDDVLVEGPCLESVSQTAANIEQITRVKRKDIRVFLDGVYIYEKA